MYPSQPGILAPLPTHARYLAFSLRTGADPRETLRQLAEQADGLQVVAGIGPSVVQRLGVSVKGLRPFSAPQGSLIDLPSSPHALWLWLRGDDPGELLWRARAWTARLADAFDLASDLPAFVHDGGRDLTGYEDGTENPQDEEAVAAAIDHGAGPGLDGGSFVAVQTWCHALHRFEAMAPQEQDHSIGRRRSDNEELDDAPDSAHVKRTAQESFDPQAFVLRRSMPWQDAGRCGLVFVAFGRSFDAFEAQLARMCGVEDGVTDALFRFTRPTDGAFYWCPPMSRNGLDLSALGLTR